MDIYWFKGMRLSLNVIAECLNVSQAYINANAKEFNMTTQEYIKGIQNCVPNTDKKYNCKQDAKGRKLPTVLVEGMTLTEISREYNVPKSTLNSRYNKGMRTINDLLICRLPNMQGDNNG